MNRTPPTRVKQGPHIVNKEFPFIQGIEAFVCSVNHRPLLKRTELRSDLLTKFVTQGFPESLVERKAAPSTGTGRCDHGATNRLKSVYGRLGSGSQGHFKGRCLGSPKSRKGLWKFTPFFESCFSTFLQGFVSSTAPSTSENLIRIGGRLESKGRIVDLKAARENRLPLTVEALRRLLNLVCHKAATKGYATNQASSRPRYDHVLDNLAKGGVVQRIKALSGKLVNDFFTDTHSRIPCSKAQAGYSVGCFCGSGSNRLGTIRSKRP